MTTLVIFLVAGAAGILLLLPFLLRHATPPVLESSSLKYGLRRRELREQKAKLILALRELDFDYETGKLSVTDYKALREKYELNTIEILKSLEIANAEWTKLQDEIDEQLSSALGPTLKKSLDHCPKCTVQVGIHDKFCGHCGTALAIHCLKCGGLLKTGDRFCASCGAQKLSVARA